MREYDKEQLISNLQFTSMHVSKVNELLARYHRIHRIPFHTLTAILAVLILLFLFWAVGLTNVIHTVAERVGASIVSIEALAVHIDDKAIIEGETDEAAATEEEPFIDISMITDIFALQSKFSTSGVFKYAIIVAIFDTIFIVGLAIGITYGLFYLYHFIQVERNKDKLKRIVQDIKIELNELEQSFIPQEYWHIPYLQRMIRYVEQDRVDDLRGCLNLMDLEIRHKQIVEALAQDQAVDPHLLTEAILPSQAKGTKKGGQSSEEVKATNLAIK